jgi:acetyltransferase-like isoleucine patch superfamily enzyme
MSNSIENNKEVKIWQPTNLYGKYKIGKGTRIGAFCDISGIIGKNCLIQTGVSIPPLTIIEDDVFIGPGVRIANDRMMDNNLKGTVIGSGTKIGMGSIIGAGLKIGKNVIIGMGSVVLYDIEDNEVFAGNPAKLIR